LSSDIVLFTDFGRKLITVFNPFLLSPPGERARERGINTNHPLFFSPPSKGRRFVKRTLSKDNEMKNTGGSF